MRFGQLLYHCQLIYFVGKVEGRWRNCSSAVCSSDAGAVDEEGVPFGPRLANLRLRWHVVSDPEVTADDGVMAYADATEDGGVGIDGDVVLDDGMAGLVEQASVGIVLEVAGAEGDALIEHDVMADDGGGTNDDSRAVVDAEGCSNLCGRMDVDARDGMCPFADDSWQQRQAELVQGVGDAMMQHGGDGGIAADDLHR